MFITGKSSRPKMTSLLTTEDPRKMVQEALETELEPETNRDTVSFNSPVDMHVHFRTGPMMQFVAPYTAQQFSGAVVMPNVMNDKGEPVLVTPEAILQYKEEIAEATHTKYVRDFEPYMTAFFRSEGYNYTELLSLRDDAGILGIKYYPRGQTTSSDHGIADPFSPAVFETLKIMSDLGIILMVHPESFGFVLHRESEFIEVLIRWHREFPDLRIVVEHITTKDAFQFVHNAGPTVSATITIHHLAMTLDDVIGGSMRPHNFCKPVAKTPEDREFLQRAAFDGNSNFCLGTDSAPHPRDKKECCGCAAGCWTAPITLQFLTQLWDRNGIPFESLKRFACTNARDIYGIEPIPKQVVVERRPYEVPSAITYQTGGITVVPWLAGETLDWSLKLT